MKYLSVTACFLPSGNGGHWHPRMVNGKELPHWREGAGLYAFVKQRRAEGWSLISTNAVPASEGVNTYHLNFRRLEIR
jgi:hypothetical protein